MPLEVVSPDATPEGADWTKTKWDLPPYRSKEFNELVPDIEAFKQSVVYKDAVAKGLIVGDEWAADDDKHPEEQLADTLAEIISDLQKNEPDNQA